MPDTANRPNIGRFFKNTPSNKNKPPKRQGKQPRIRRVPDSPANLKEQR